MRAVQAALQHARALAMSLEALEAELGSEQPDDQLRGLEAASQATGILASTLRAWCRSGRLQHSKGARSAYLVTVRDVREAARAPSAPVKPSKIAKPPKAANDSAELDEFEAAIARGDLVATR